MRKRDVQGDSYAGSRFGLKFLLVALSLGLFKLWLVSGDEIVTGTSPHDSLWYVHSASEWYWFGPYTAPYGVPPFIRLPAYPLFIALIKQTGFPLRIANELLLLAAAFVFVVSIFKAGQSRVLAILLYSAIIFHPASFVINDEALPDSLYAAVLLLALALIINLLLNQDNRHRLRYAVLTGTTLAILWHIRQESVIIVGLLITYGLIALFLIGIRMPIRVIARRLGVVVLIPAAIIFLASLTVKTVNYYKFGIFAPDALSGPGFEAARTALLRIEPVQPIRFVAVTKEARLRAYEISPAFREMEPQLEGPEGQRWESYAGLGGVLVNGEISTPHFLWALNKAAYDIGYDKSARLADQYFQRVANEINAGCKDGRLRCRWAFSSVLDPSVRTYSRYLPASFGRIHSLGFARYELPRRDELAGLQGQVNDLFDRMLNRRIGSSAPYSMTRISGWVFDLKDDVRTVLIRDSNGQVLASSDELGPRPDVVSSFIPRGVTVPLKTGFYLQYLSTEQDNDKEMLVFIKRNGTELVVPRTQAQVSLVTQDSLTYAIDRNEVLITPRELTSRFQHFIGAVYGPATKILAFLCIGAIVALLLCYTSINPRDAIYWILVLLLATVFTRMMLFTLIDASSYPAAAPRYLYPVMHLYTCCFLLLIAEAIKVVTIRLKRSNNLRKAAA